MRLKDLVRDKIPRELHQYIPSSFDIIGSRAGAVAIVEIPKELEEYKHVIADAIVKLNKHVRSVLRKISGRQGLLRLYEFEILISGPTEVLHKEHGYLIKVDPTKVYFSPRDHSDRLDIARQVKPGEVILYLFAGVGPYAIAICKFCPDVRIIHAVEINPWGIHYMIENIRLNRLRGKIVPLEGDVREIAPKFYETADRVLMTLPLGAHEYLELGLCCIRKEGGIVHFYHLGREPDVFREAEEIVYKVASHVGREVVIVNKRVVRDYAPRTYKVRLDILVK